MIDIHTHILPGLDDGAQTMEDAVLMARAASLEGITDLIATPHHANGSYMNYAADVIEAVDRLNERLQAERVPVTVHPGQEIRVHDDLLDALGRKELLSLGYSAYVLIEMPHHKVPYGMPELLHELSVLGVRPIIAHPERNGDILKDASRLDELLEHGAYTQVTSQSLLGGFGTHVSKCAWQLCRTGRIHIVSSDAHDIGRRSFQMREAYETIEQEMGVLWSGYFEDNAQCVLQDRDFGRMPEVPKQPKSLLKSLKFFRNR